MRELKFRVWDKNKKEWWSYENKAYLNVSLTFDGRPLFWTGDECRFEGKIWPEEWVIQQFTGLKDKNNKEIYEGDIINCYEKCDIDKQFLKTVTCSWDQDFAWFQFQEKDEISEDGCLWYELCEAEVVENICENNE